MGEKAIGIIWPSLGNPVIIDGKEQRGSFSVIAHLDGQQLLGKDGIRAWLVPVDSAFNESLLLDLASFELTRLESIQNLGRFSDWMVNRIKFANKFDFNVPKIQNFLGRRNILFDLHIVIGAQEHVRAGSVCITNPQKTNTQILTAADIHIARRWDEICKEVSDLFSPRPVRPPGALKETADFHPEDVWSRDCFMDSFINPNSNFEALIREANKMWRDGLLDYVVLMGDLVDYKFSRFKSQSGNGYSDTDWSLFIDIISGKARSSERLLVPVFTLTGNHDYRLYPYKLQIYGLRHCGISDDFTEEYLKRSGKFLKLKYRFSDLDAVRVKTDKEHSLDHYYRKLNPFDNYTLSLGDINIIILDTGPDFFSDTSYVFTSRWARFLLGMETIVAAPYSNGFSDEQLHFMTEGLQEINDTPALVITHAPLLSLKKSFTNNQNNSDTSPPSINMSRVSSQKDFTKKEKIRFEKYLAEKELDYGTVFRNQLPFLEAVQDYPGQVLVLSGHNHQEQEIQLDKTTGHITLGESSKKNEVQTVLNSKVLFLQLSALAHVKRQGPRGNLPGYKIFTFSKRGITSVSSHQLLEKPFDTGSYDWSVTTNGNHESVSIEIGPAPGLKTGEEIVHKIICMLNSTEGKFSSNKINSMRIDGFPKDAILYKRDNLSQEDEAGKYISFLVEDKSNFKLILKKRPKNIAVIFLFERYLKEKERYISLGLRRHHIELR